MKIRKTTLFFGVLFGSVAFALAADTLPPKLSLRDAIPVAEDYAKTFEDKDLSRFYLGSARLKEGSNGTLHWEIGWISTNRVTKPNLKPQSFGVVVDMRRGCSRIPTATSD